LIRINEQPGAWVHSESGIQIEVIFMFRHRQLLRRWAARLLVLWLLGVGISVANACLTSGVATPDHVAHSTSPALHGGGATAHHGSLVTANCQDFCAKVTVSVPLLKAALDDVQAHAMGPIQIGPAVPVPAEAPVQPWKPRQDTVLALPIAIAYLRLAL
jgi:hypothetical protein